MNQPIKALFMSRKFLLLLADTIISLGLFFVGKYSPLAYEDVAFIIGVLQPVFIAVIAGIAYEDGQAKSAG